MMKKNLILLVALAVLSSCGGTHSARHQSFIPNDLDTATVYFTEEISPESLLKIYRALGVEPKGKVAVKISTGEAGGHNYLKPELIGLLVGSVDGTIVECNTAYPGKRMIQDCQGRVVGLYGKWLTDTCKPLSCGEIGI